MFLKHTRMDCFSDAYDEFRLTFNPPPPKKNTVMLQLTPGELYIPPSMYVMGKKLEVTFVYLGIKLSRHNALNKEVNYIPYKVFGKFA